MVQETPAGSTRPASALAQTSSRIEPGLDICSWSTHEAPSAAKGLVIRQSDAERQLPVSVSRCEIPASDAPETQGWAAAQAMMARKRMQRQSPSFAVIFLLTLISGMVVSGPSTPLRRRGRWYLLYEGFFFPPFFSPTFAHKMHVHYEVMPPSRNICLMR